MSDRRVARRIAARLRVWCEGDEFTLLSETANVSRRGLFLRTASTLPPPGPFKVTIDALGVVASVVARWSVRGPDVATPGLGVEIVSFERGGPAYGEYVERLSSRSGEHRISWPPSEAGGGQGEGDGGSE